MSEKAVAAATPITKARAKKQVEARYCDYVEFFKEELGPIFRDIFSDDIFYYCSKRKRFFPAMHEVTLGRLQSRACDSGGRLKPGHIECHLFALRDELEPDLLIEIPEWDGVDRVEKIAEALTLKNMEFVHAYELLKEWGAGVWHRYNDPYRQNRVLILTGSQNAGKSTLIETITGGLGQFCTPIAFFDNEKDTYAQVSGALIGLIDEFDRGNRASESLLKHVITSPKLNYRVSHGRKSVDHPNRMSFIASCNPENILRDWTGARRYIVMELEGIKWTYPSDFDAEKQVWDPKRPVSKQILAQFKALSEMNGGVGYKASAETRKILSDYLEVAKPINPDNEMIADFGHWLVAQLATRVDGRDYLYSHECNEFWDRCRSYNKTRNYIQSLLSKAGWRVRKKKGSAYEIPGKWLVENGYKDDENNAL